MKQTYTIPEANRERVEKLVARYQKKAAKYGVPMHVEYGEPRAERVNVYKNDRAEHVTHKVDDMLVEVFDLTIEGDEIRKDGYAVVAKIEHLDGGNVVNTFGATMKPEWRTADCTCQHCNSKRDRRLTFIVRHEDGSEKQVGRSCLKDYCGIDPQGIGTRNELHDLLIDEDVDGYDFEARPVAEAYNVMDALALAIRILAKQGYIKSGERGSNKEEIAAEIKKARFTDDERRKADELAQAISMIDANDAITANLNNVQGLIHSGYCKQSHFGYIAYAPVAFEKYIEEMKRRAEREAAKSAERASEYVGQVGKRIDVDIANMKLVTSWETQWGWTWLYKFIDTDGNVLVWFASKPFERVNEDGEYEDVTSVNRIRATVKEHSERGGVKQTIITRCKAA